MTSLWFIDSNTFTHLLAANVLVSATCMTRPLLSHWREWSLGSIRKVVLCNKVFCERWSTGHHYHIITELNRTMFPSMSYSERAFLGRRAVQRNPFGGSWIDSADKKDRVFRCRTAVISPGGSSVLKMLPWPLLIKFTGVSVASNQVAGDKVDLWAFHHLPWIVVEDTAPLLGITSRPKLNLMICRETWIASYDKDSCKEQRF